MNDNIKTHFNLNTCRGGSTQTLDSAEQMDSTYGDS